MRILGGVIAAAIVCALVVLGPMAFAGGNGVGSGGLNGFPAAGSSAADFTDGGALGGCTIIAGTIYCPVGKFDKVDAGSELVNGQLQVLGPTFGAAATFTGAVSGLSVGATTEDGLTQKLGSSAVFISPALVLAVRTTSVGNIGAGEDDLQTVTLPANGLTTTGHCIHWDMSGTFAANANAKTLKIYFGTTAMQTITAPTVVGGNWHGFATICRTGANAQKYASRVDFMNSATNVVTNAFDTQGTSTETETATIVIKQTGEAVSNNDLVGTLTTMMIY